MRFIVLWILSLSLAICFSSCSKSKSSHYMKAEKVASALNDRIDQTSQFEKTPKAKPSPETQQTSQTAEPLKAKAGDQLEHFGLPLLIKAKDGGSKPVFTDNFVGSKAKAPAKVLWINFFASWCEPCKKELPLLSKLYDTYKSKGLMVLSVNIDKTEDEIAEAVSFINEIKPSYPVVGDRFQVVTRRYFSVENTVSLPANLIVDSSGKVLKIADGTDATDLRGLENRIRQELGLSLLKAGEKGTFNKK